MEKKTTKYDVTDISVGDEVYFDVIWQNNYDLYWVVKSIFDNETIEIEIDTIGAKDKMFLKIKDIEYLIKAEKNFS